MVSNRLYSYEECRWRIVLLTLWLKTKIKILLSNPLLFLIEAARRII